MSEGIKRSLLISSLENVCWILPQHFKYITKIGLLLLEILNDDNIKADFTKLEKLQGT